MTYDASVGGQACANFANNVGKTTYYTPGITPLADGVGLFVDSNCTTFVDDGYYSDGTNWWYISGGTLSTQTTCSIEWYTLTKCFGGGTITTKAYPFDTFNVNDRVHIGTAPNQTYYTITTVHISDPGGSHTSPISDSTTSCPSAVDYTISSDCPYPLGKVTVNTLSGGLGTYQITTNLYSTSVAALAATTWESITTSKDYTSVSDGTYYVAVRDAGDIENIISKSVVVACTTTTTTSTSTSTSTTSTTTAAPTSTSTSTTTTTTIPLPPGETSTTTTSTTEPPTTTTTLQQVWYQLTNCNGGGTVYSTNYNIGYAAVTDRVFGNVLGVPSTLVVASILFANPGGTQIGIVNSGLTGCPASTTTTTTTTQPPTTTTTTSTSTSTSTTTLGTTAAPTVDIYIQNVGSLDIPIGSMTINGVAVTWVGSGPDFVLSAGDNGSFTSTQIGTYDVVIAYGGHIPGQRISFKDSANVITCQTLNGSIGTFTITNATITAGTTIEVEALDGVCP
jgi:hypothetical protein